MQLTGFEVVNGKITCLTGLRIGGTKEAVGLGETDNPIIRHPITKLPYIPGSSLKGKLRSLLESKYSSDSQQTGKPCGCGKCEICALFGRGNPSQTSEPTRLIFRDAPVSEKTRQDLEEALPGLYVEVKTEIQMDRKEGKAARGALRQQERVPEGSIFDFSFSIRRFKEDEKRISQFRNMLAEAFELLESDYLGGLGTRGYGKVKITAEDGTPMHEYIRNMKL